MISIVIQAGGQSKRMGQDKGLIPLAGIPMIEHVLNGIADLGEEILITTNNPEGYDYLGIKLIPDQNPGAGALTGLQTALQASKGEQVFVIACDMPFPSPRLINHLLSFNDRGDAIVPFVKDRFQPLHAVYRRKICLSAINKAIEKDQKRAISFYPDIHVVKIEEKEISNYADIERTFFNVNTPTDLELAELMYRQAQGNSDQIE